MSNEHQAQRHNYSCSDDASQQYRQYFRSCFTGRQQSGRFFQIPLKGGGIGAENNFIVSASGATEGASGVVFSVAVTTGALAIEKFRIMTGTATVGMIPRATILWCLETSAGAIASVGNPQFRGTDGTYCAVAANCWARIVGGYDRHRQIESIDERDVVKVLFIDRILDQSCRSDPKPFTV